MCRGRYAAVFRRTIPRRLVQEIFKCFNRTQELRDVSGELELVVVRPDHCHVMRVRASIWLVMRYQLMETVRLPLIHCQDEPFVLFAGQMPGDSGSKSVPRFNHGLSVRYNVASIVHDRLRVFLREPP